MKQKTTYFILAIVLFSYFIGFSQKGVLTPEKQHISSRLIIKDNLIAIKSAIYAIKTNKKESNSKKPYLSLAYDYQRKAIELYKAGNHESAIYHALKSRKYALIEITNNRGRIQENHRVMFGVLFKYFDKDEDYYVNLKEQLYDYSTDSFPVVDSLLDSNVIKTNSNPDINDPKIVADFENKCRLR